MCKCALLLSGSADVAVWEWLAVHDWGTKVLISLISEPFGSVEFIASCSVSYTLSMYDASQ